MSASTSNLKIQAQKVILVVLESHLEARFSQFAIRHKLPVIKLGLKPRFSKNILVLCTNRLLHLKNIKAALRNNLPEGDHHKFILSNAEGYIAATAIEHIRRKYPKSIIGSIQHGDFELVEKTWLKKLSINTLNCASKLLQNGRIIGYGFGGIVLDFYVVYNSHYSQYLSEVWRGRSKYGAIVSANFILGPLEPPNEVGKKSFCKKRVLFALQPLAEMGIVNKNVEMLLNSLVIFDLKKRHDKIYVRQHPYAESIGDFSDCFSLNPAQPIEDQITEHEIGSIASYSSSLLHRFEHWPINVQSYYNESLSKFDDAYFHFRNVREIDLRKKSVQASTRFKKNDFNSPFYEIGFANVAGLLKAIKNMNQHRSNKLQHQKNKL